jgi:hypothetical protein
MKFRCLGLISAALLAGTAAASAYDVRSNAGSIVIAQAPSQPAPAGPMQPNAAGESQAPNAKPGGGGQPSPTRPSASQADQAVPPHASATHEGSTETAPNVQGQSGPPGATAQTMPSTISAENAKEDKRAIMEHALDLTEDQRQQIAARMLTNAPATSGAATEAGGDLAVSKSVPASISMHDFPGELAGQISALGKYKYIQLPGRLLVVEPNNRIVVAEIHG